MTRLRKHFGMCLTLAWLTIAGCSPTPRPPILDQSKATAESDALSKDLKKRGMTFVGSTIIYAHMQATGLVNDHLTACFRHKPCAKLK